MVFLKLLLIKEFYGSDISIISCEELSKNGYGNCEKLIMEYMPNYAQIRIIPYNGIINSSKIEINNKTKILEPNHNWKMLVKILSTKYPLKEAKLKAKKIIKRAEKYYMNL